MPLFDNAYLYCMKGNKISFCQLNELEELKNSILEKYVLAIQRRYRAYSLRKRFKLIRKGNR